MKTSVPFFGGLQGRLGTQRYVDRGVLLAHMSPQIVGLDNSSIPNILGYLSALTADPNPDGTYIPHVCTYVYISAHT
jgi:hypothetical protein